MLIREQEISQISRALKGLAKELDVPVMALSQLSREVEKRGSSKKPILSDLRESGSIEQDADQVMFIYRPEYYGLTEDEDHNPTAGVAEIIIAKNRHGAVSDVRLKFINQFARFGNLEEYNISPDGNGTITLRSNASDEDDDTPF
jgi:replicative DNA helicase